MNQLLRVIGFLTRLRIPRGRRMREFQERVDNEPESSAASHIDVPEDMHQQTAEGPIQEHCSCRCGTCGGPDRAMAEQTAKLILHCLSESDRLAPGERQDVRNALISAVDIADLALGVEDGSASQESPFRGLLLARSKLLRCLSSLGIERVDAGGGAVDLANQEIALVSDTGDMELDARVASVIRAGYRTEKGIVRQALVRVYRYNPAMANQEGGRKDGKDKEE